MDSKEINRICKEPEFMARFTNIEEQIISLKKYLGINLLVLSLVCFALLLIFITIWGD